MSLVWRKIQRSNKKAAKFSFDATLSESEGGCKVELEVSPSWQPGKVGVAWAHRRRRVAGTAAPWEPSLFDSYKGRVLWPPSDNLRIITTLYRHPRQDSYEPKEWTFLLEEVSGKGRRKAVAAVSLNLPLFVSTAPSTTTELKLKMRPLCEDVVAAVLHLVLTSTVLRVGDPNDDDMMSIASGLSRTGSVRSQREISPIPGDQPGVSGLSPGSGEEIKEVADSMAVWFREKGSADPTLPTLKEAGDPEASSPVIKRRESPGRKRKFGPEGDLIRPTLSPPSSATKPSSTPNAATTTVTNDSHPTGMEEEREKRVFASGIVLPRGSEEEEKAEDVPDQPVLVQRRIKGLDGAGSGDLLGWCQGVTAGYRGVRIENLCESFRSGLAFAAIIHAFRPDLIDYNSLHGSNIRENCEAAFAASDALSIPRLIQPEEFVIRQIPVERLLTKPRHPFPTLNLNLRTRYPS